MKTTAAFKAGALAGLFCLSAVTASGFQTFPVNLDFDLDGQLTATLIDDIELVFTADVDADFVLVLENAFSSEPSGGFELNASSFAFERNGNEVVPSETPMPMGYLGAPLEAIDPRDYFIEIGPVSFAEGDAFTISGAIVSNEIWTGEVPDSGPSFNAFLATTEGVPIENVALIPEPRAAALLAGFLAWMALGLRGRRRRDARFPESHDA